MGKRLIICCDGTWKSSKDPRISNVEKIARAVKTDATDGAVQLVHYVNGVGTGSSWSDRVFGGAFGRGLDANLLDAYRFLVLNYEPDDEIFVSGFSRGAYTARSLAGMIGKVGLITPRQLAEDSTSNLFEKALELYRDKKKFPALGARCPSPSSGCSTPWALSAYPESRGTSTSSTMCILERRSTSPGRRWRSTSAA